MIGRLACVGLLALVMITPAKQASAQDNILGGAIIGGAAGGLIGGALGGGRAVVPGIIIGAAAGAIIASEGERRRGNHYYYRNNCYIQRSDGSYLAVHPRNCDARAEYVPQPAAPAGDAASYCMSRYRSYDPASGTYMGYDGVRRPCP